MRRKQSHQDESIFAMSIGDLMASLLGVFCMVMVGALLQLQTTQAKVNTMKEETQKITKTFSRSRQAFMDALDTEFKAELKKWNGHLDKKKGSIVFQDPEVMFAQGSSDLQPAFKDRLKVFFPRLVKLVRRPEFRDQIEELRIEGHTSTEWATGGTKEEAYHNNMVLSQARSLSVLNYSSQVLNANDRDWLRKRISASGFSSSHTLPEGGKEDPDASRRVEFRFRLTAEKALDDIEGMIQKLSESNADQSKPAQ